MADVTDDLTLESCARRARWSANGWCAVREGSFPPRAAQTPNGASPPPPLTRVRRMHESAKLRGRARACRAGGRHAGADGRPPGAPHSARDWTSAALQQRRHFLEGQGLAEQEDCRTRRSAAARQPWPAPRHRRLGHHAQVERARQHDDHLHQRHGGSSRSMVMTNERSIFERVEGHLRQVGERGVAGAEIVDRDAHAELADFSWLADVALESP